jgi:hypothetical protein
MADNGQEESLDRGIAGEGAEGCSHPVADVLHDFVG